MLILSSEQANIFTHEDLNIINLLATQATIALKNAQLNTQILQNTEALEKEITEREQVEMALRDSPKDVTHDSGQHTDPSFLEGFRSELYGV